MEKAGIFISHATCDDDFVRELREKLEILGIGVWVDSRELRGGDQLNPAIAQAIREARHVIVVLSPQTQNSMWVRKEIRLAELEIANIRDRYSVFSQEELYQAIQDGTAVEHPAWEDHIVWKNKLAHIQYLRQLATG